MRVGFQVTLQSRSTGQRRHLGPRPRARASGSSTHSPPRPLCVGSNPVPLPLNAPLAAFAHRACFARRELRTLAHERRLRTGLLTWSLLHKRGLLSPLRAHPAPPEAAQAAFFLRHPWAVLQGPMLAPAAAPPSNPAEWRHPGPRAGSSPRAPQRAALLGQYTC